MLGDKEIGQRVLVYDCEMYYTGIGMAEKLVREGKDVTYVTPFEAMAPYTVYTLEFPRLNRHLRQLGIDVVVEHVVTAIEPGRPSWRRSGRRRSTPSRSTRSSSSRSGCPTTPSTASCRATRTLSPLRASTASTRSATASCRR